MPLTAALCLGASMPVSHPFAGMPVLMDAGAPGAISLEAISTDPLVSAPGQHATEVEPDALGHGRDVLAAFQVGRRRDGGSAAIGWAFWNGRFWRHGLLPGITTSQPHPGPYTLVSDPAVAYDAARRVWLVSSLAVIVDRPGSVAPGRTARISILVSQSADGTHWDSHGSPFVVAATSATLFYDKDWITCDSSAASPFYGRCYATWDHAGRVDHLLMSTSVDGGITWSPPVAPLGGPDGLAGEPVVQPDGTVIVPALGETRRGIDVIAFASADGGARWGRAHLVASIRSHPVEARMRAGPLPSAAISGHGTVYVAWQDCRYEPHCAGNDIVMSSSRDGTHWSPVARIPISPAGHRADYFIPALAAGTATAKRGQQLALTYYYFHNGQCTVATCLLYAGFISSSNGGATWADARRLAGPMHVTWLARTTLRGNGGFMVGDYSALTFADGTAVAVFAAAKAPDNGRLDEAMYVVQINRHEDQRTRAAQYRRPSL
jgi:hypothetical protein